MFDPISYSLAEEAIKYPTTTASYTVYKEGDYVVAENGRTGKTIIENIDFSTVMNYLINKASEGSKIKIMRGIYTANSTIEIIKSGIFIEGENRGLTKTPATEIGTIIKMGANLTDGVFYIHGTALNDFVTWNRVSNLTILGDNRSYVGTGIKAEYTKHLILDHLQIEDIDGYAIEYHTCHGSTLSYSRIQNCGNTTNSQPAIWISDTEDKTTTPYFLFNIFEPCYYGWIHVDTTYPSGIQPFRGRLIGNYFEDDGTKGEIGIVPSSRWEIIGNEFLGNINRVFIKTFTDTYGIVIEANHFNQGGRNLGTTDGQILLGSVRSIVANNIFESPQGPQAIYLDTSLADTIIANNVIMDCPYHGIRTFNNVYRVKIKSNTLHNISSSVTYGAAIQVAGNNNIISGNKIHSSAYGIRIYAGDNNRVIDNELHDVTNPFVDNGTNTFVAGNDGIEKEMIVLPDLGYTF